jgi:hypothetical protein
VEYESLLPAGTGRQAEGIVLADASHIPAPRPRRKTRSSSLLSDAQARALKQIAHASGILVTKTPKKTVYPLCSGAGAIPASMVKALIKAGALIAMDGGLFDDTQSFRARRPGDDR